MNRKIYFLLLLLPFISCQKENEWDAGNEEGTTSVTFQLNGLDNGDFSASVTRAAETIIPVDFSQYAVRFYLFEENGTDRRGEPAYILKESLDVTEPTFTMEKLTANANYKYVFIATKADKAETEIKALLTPRDFGEFNPDYPDNTLPEIKGQSLISNSYLPIAQTDAFDYSATTAQAPESSDIYAEGFDLSTSFTFHTPIGIVLKKQVGMVEFRIKLDAGSHTLSCSIPSDFYRLYLSQIARVDMKSEYTSLNHASVTNTSYADFTDYISGDYYSGFGSPSLLSFTREETVTVTNADEYTYFRIYMPYTTAASVGTAVADEQKANYNRTSKAAGTMTLTIDGTSYTYKEAFPIYRDAKTYFYIQGDKLIADFTGGTDGGIDLDDNEWDGWEEPATN